MHALGARCGAGRHVVAVLLVVGALSCVVPLAAAAPSARELNEQALDLAIAGKLEDALPLFEAAAAAAPESPEYHNNVGVTHMRLNNLDDARACFERALKIDPAHGDAVRNMDELATLAGDDEDQGIQHTLLPIPRIPLRELYQPHNTEFARGLRPFVLTEAMQDAAWTRARRTWSADYFAERFPDSVTDFYPHNMDNEKVRPFLTRWTEALREYKVPSDKFPHSRTHPGTYIQWNLGEEEWEWLREDEMGFLPPQFTLDEAWLKGCLPTEELRTEFCKETHWRMVLIGNEGAGMFNHRDTLRTSSFQAQVKGAKTWHLCGPDQTPYMYSAGKVDWFKPNYKRYPLARNATCYMYTIKAGEMLYYPRDWWHNTRNEAGENIAITGTVADGLNFDSISEELARDVKRENPIIMSPSPALTAALPGCYQWLRDAYGGGLQ